MRTRRVRRRRRVADLPLLRRFPALARLPRAELGVFPTSVQRVTLDDGRILLLKRDDRSGDPLGGNKVRALEFLLGGVGPGTSVVTAGARGSTHALSTAVHARRLGAQVVVARWNQVMNPAARVVDARLREAAQVVDAHFVAAAYAVALAQRLRGARWIPPGGASPLGALGHVNAALELAEQVDRGECELPEVVVVPLGTAGTAAGLALGFRIAGLGIHVVGVRVVPRVVANRRRLLRLSHRTAALIEQHSGTRLPRVDRRDVSVEHDFYAGAYGRPLAVPPREEDRLRTLGVQLDDTYSRKAFAAAIARRNHRVLFWLTFDGRLLQNQFPDVPARGGE
jgi:D-cysteine desulfhydrase